MNKDFRELEPRTQNVIFMSKVERLVILQFRLDKHESKRDRKALWERVQKAFTDLIDS